MISSFLFFSSRFSFLQAFHWVIRFQFSIESQEFPSRFSQGHQISNSQLNHKVVVKNFLGSLSNLQTFKVVDSKKVQSTTCKYPSCHLNLEPKKFLQLFEFSSQAQVTANESEELPQSFFSDQGTMCDLGFGAQWSQHGCMPSDWRCHMFNKKWNGSVTFPLRDRLSSWLQLSLATPPLKPGRRIYL